MTIREYQPADRDQVEVCVTELQHFECALEADRVAGDEAATQYWQTILDEHKKHNGICYVAEVAGTVAGFISGWVEEMGDDYVVKPGKEFYVSDLMVRAPFRHQGIGKALMEKLIEYAKTFSVRAIRVTVLDTNQVAQDAYTSYGFAGYERTLRKEL